MCCTPAPFCLLAHCYVSLFSRHFVFHVYVRSFPNNTMTASAKHLWFESYFPALYLAEPHKSLLVDPRYLTSDLPLNRTEIHPFFRRSFSDRNPKRDSKNPDWFILLRIARRFQRNKVHIFISFVPEIIGIENREISRKPKVSPSGYIAFSRIFDSYKKLVDVNEPFHPSSRIQKDLWKFVEMSELSRFSWYFFVDHFFMHFIWRCQLPYMCFSPLFCPLLRFFRMYRGLVNRYRWWDLIHRKQWNSGTTT
jgi:hypothetical protein